MVRLVSWNMARRHVAWNGLADCGADVALLQEAVRPGPAWAHLLTEDDDQKWETALLGRSGRWRTAVVPLSAEMQLRRRPTADVQSAAAAGGALVTSRAGSIAVAAIAPAGQVQFTVASVYAAWEMAAGRGYADGSAHRILSDLSALMPSKRHRLIVAGDWNLLYGYGEHGNTYWRDRYAAVFSHAEALGLRLIGPFFPAGRRADPWPDELPRESLCVPTFHHARQSPATATRQLDFVFASEGLAEQVVVQAMNHPDEWGPSDHCRILIDVNS